MELRNLNTFLRVAALRNFTRASQELGYSQSNVSAQIKQLEQELGHPLFDRIGRNVFLTSYGEALLPYARQVVSTVLQMENFMKSEATLGGGTLRVGMTDSLSELRLDDALLRFHQRFPKMKLEMTLDATAALIDYLRHGQLDAACLIGDPLSQAEWAVWSAWETPIVLVSNPAHPLACRREVSLSELAEQDLILMASNSVMIRMLIGEIRQCSRTSKGVRVMRMPEDVSIVSIAVTDHEEGEELTHPEDDGTADEGAEPDVAEEQE